MKDLQRNKQKIYYALYQGVTDRTDSNGYYTGEKVITYGTPVELKINVSGALGKDEVMDFGLNIPYDRIMTTADKNCPIDEKSVLWIGVANTEKANYRVTAKRESPNGIIYAIAKADRT